METYKVIGGAQLQHLLKKDQRDKAFNTLPQYAIWKVLPDKTLKKCNALIMNAVKEIPHPAWMLFLAPPPATLLPRGQSSPAPQNGVISRVLMVSDFLIEWEPIDLQVERNGSFHCLNMSLRSICLHSKLKGTHVGDVRQRQACTHTHGGAASTYKHVCVSVCVYRSKNHTHMHVQLLSSVQP